MRIFVGYTLIFVYPKDIRRGQTFKRPRNTSRREQILVQKHPTPSEKELIAYLREASDRLQRSLRIDKATATRLCFYELISQVAGRIGHTLPFDDLELIQLSRSTVRMQFGAELIIDNPSLLDNIFESIVDENYRKTKGQFLTPPQIAQFMVSWGISERCQSILDPAVGTGIFLHEAYQSLGQDVKYVMYGIDIDPVMLNAASLRLALAGVPRNRITLIQEDFLKTQATSKKFDLVICNPPYLNFHDFECDVDTSAIERSYGIRLSRLTNIYALFFIRATSFVKEDGKMVFITPSEFFYTGYGEDLRSFLLKNFTIDAFVLIDFSKTVFNKALTTAVITLLRKAPPRGNHKVKFVRVFRWPEDNKTLMDVITVGVADSHYCKLYQVPQAELDPTDKWLVHFEENGYASIIEKLSPLSRMARVDRGIATGHNGFFVLSQNEVAQWKIEDRFLKPVISKAVHVMGYDFTQDDYERLKNQQEKVFLLYCFEEPSENLRRYIEYGEKLGADQRYLTRHRKPWYSMEKGKVAPILATVFSRSRMRFILNKTDCVNLAAFHGIYPNFQDEVMVKALLAYLNSNLCKDVQTIKRREYGGGLHKFEPKDLEKLPVLDVTKLSRDDLERLSRLFDELCRSARISASDEEKVKTTIDTELRRILMIPERPNYSVSEKLP